MLRFVLTEPMRRRTLEQERFGYGLAMPALHFGEHADDANKQMLTLAESRLVNLLHDFE